MRTYLRGKIALLFMTLGLLLAIPATALAADLISDAELGSSVATATNVTQGKADNEFKIKVWAKGNLNLSNSSVTGKADVVTKYSMASTSPYGITASTAAADKQTLDFKAALAAAGVNTSQAYNYNDCPTTGTIPKGCPANPFELTATLDVPANVPVDTTSQLKVDLIGSQALDVSNNNPVSEDTGYVKVVAPPPPANTAPQVSVDGVTNGDSYEIGSVPSATCEVTDTEDGTSSFAATLSSITGSLSAYGLGSQTASCSYTDQGGLGPATDSVTYSIVDTGKPVITDRGFKAGTAGTNGWYTSAVTNEFRATDSGAGFQTTTPPLLQYDFTKSSGTAEGSAVEIASGTVSDVAGNVGDSIYSAAYKIDLSNPTNVQFSGGPAASGSYDFGNVPAAPTCTADDAVSGLKDCVVTGYSSAVGSHTLTAKATDNAGLTATATRSYTVNAWNLSGFFSPVDMDSGTTIALNTVKGGSTVPLKFEVFQGTTELTNTSAIKSFSTKAVPCPGADAAVDEIEFLTTGGTSLRYDTTAGQFIQNWQTPKKTGCHDVTMETQDGSKIVAHFKLR